MVTVSECVHTPLHSNIDGIGEGRKVRRTRGMGGMDEKAAAAASAFRLLSPLII